MANSKAQYIGRTDNNFRIPDLVQVLSYIENGGLIKATVVYRCSKFVNLWTKNKIGVTNQN